MTGHTGHDHRGCIQVPFIIVVVGQHVNHDGHILICGHTIVHGNGSGIGQLWPFKGPNINNGDTVEVAICNPGIPESPLVGGRGIRVVTRIDGRASRKKLMCQRKPAVVLKGTHKWINGRTSSTNQIAGTGREREVAVVANQVVAKGVDGSGVIPFRTVSRRVVSHNRIAEVQCDRVGNTTAAVSGIVNYSAVCQCRCTVVIVVDATAVPVGSIPRQRAIRDSQMGVTAVVDTAAVQASRSVSR